MKESKYLIKGFYYSFLVAMDILFLVTDWRIVAYLLSALLVFVIRKVDLKYTEYRIMFALGVALGMPTASWIFNWIINLLK